MRSGTELSQFLRVFSTYIYTKMNTYVWSLDLGSSSNPKSPILSHYVLGSFRLFCERLFCERLIKVETTQSKTDKKLVTMKKRDKKYLHILLMKKYTNLRTSELL